MYENDNPERLWSFLATVNRSAFNSKVDEIRQHFQGPLHEDGAEVDEFRRYISNRFFVNIERMRSGGRTHGSNEPIEGRQIYIQRRQRYFVRQVQNIAQVSGAGSIRLFLALILSFRESAWKAAFMSTLRSSFGGGGLDNLYQNQQRYRVNGVLAASIRFPSGRWYGYDNTETKTDLDDKIRDAEVQGSQILIAYAASTGYAALRVQTALNGYRSRVNNRGGGWEPNFEEAPLVCQNLMIALAFAASFGIEFNTWARVGHSDQGLGIKTLVSYMSERRIPVSELLSVMNFQGGRSHRDFPFREVIRMQSAQNAAIAATALRELYDNGIP